MKDEVSEVTGMKAENFMTQADKFLLSHGIITDVTHNNIILNLYRNFPSANYIEYYLDMTNREIEVHMYLGRMGWWFGNKNKLKANCAELLGQYLSTFTIKTEIHPHVSIRRR
jgi:hypothetical protein